MSLVYLNSTGTSSVELQFQSLHPHTAMSQQSYQVIFGSPLLQIISGGQSQKHWFWSIISILNCWQVHKIKVTVIQNGFKDFGLDLEKYSLDENIREGFKEHRLKHRNKLILLNFKVGDLSPLENVSREVMRQ